MPRKKVNKTDAAIKQLNVAKIDAALKGLVASIFTGEPLEEEKVTIELSVPRLIYDIVEEACENTGADINEVFSKMASGGLNDSLSLLVEDQAKIADEIDEEEAKVEKPTSPLKGEAKDLAKELAGIQDFATKLKEISKMMETLNASGDGPTLNIPPEIFKGIK